MEKIFLEFLNIYFWVFISVMASKMIGINTTMKEFKENKKNALKNGTYNFSSSGAIIMISLFVLSIILT